MGTLTNRIWNVLKKPYTPVVLAIAALAVVAIVVVLVLVQRARSAKTETFDLGKIFEKVKTGVTGVKNLAVSSWNSVVNKQQQQPAYQPTYVGRTWDGNDWSCPWWTVDTGMEDAKGCISSQYHNPLWRWNGKEWGWSCPNGTVETDESQWEKKCEVGWMGRQLIDGKWQCPQGTTDSGNTWESSSWRDAQKQCRRGGPYTTRILKDDKWQCPEGSEDTGRTWGQAGEWNQCKWKGG